MNSHKSTTENVTENNEMRNIKDYKRTGNTNIITQANYTTKTIACQSIEEDARIN
jgi:hypothetical protein